MKNEGLIFDAQSRKIENHFQHNLVQNLFLNTDLEYLFVIFRAFKVNGREALDPMKFF